MIAVSAQLSHLSAADIVGKIKDATGQNAPVEFANIQVLTCDSVYVAGTVSGMDGTFIINGLTEGNYLLAASCIGYETGYNLLEISHINTDMEIRLEPASVMLGSITVEARQVIDKPDRKMIIPASEQVRMATDGADLLRKMQLPRIMVDPVNGEITLSGGGNLQLRINGVEVNDADIAALNPADILRIEYHDDPGVRYGNTEAVIDYITRRKESGGNVRTALQHNIGGKKTGINDMLAVKFHNGKSEWSAHAGYIHRKQDFTRGYDETFRYPGRELRRTEKGEPTPFDKRLFNSAINYGWVEKDKYFLNAQLRFTHLNFPGGGEDRRSTVTTSISDEVLSVTDHTTERSNSPALDLYFQRNLPDGQLLIFNVVGTYIGSHTTRLYKEESEGAAITGIFSDISGNKYSLIGEAVYERQSKAGKLTAGIRHLQAYTDNRYAGTIAETVELRQAESRMYAEYLLKYSKWSATANLTGERLYYSQYGDKTVKYSVYPAARFTFAPSDDMHFRYGIRLRNNMPSLSYLNDVQQAIDPLQVRRGNPDLKPFHSVIQTFTAGYNQKLFGAEFLISYDYQNKPVMESVLFEDDVFVRTYFNQKSFQDIGFELTLKLKPWKEHLSLSVAPKLNRYISTGNDYLHTYTMTELRVNADFIYQNFAANFTMATPPRSFYGEKLVTSDQFYYIMAGYKRSLWSVMAGMTSPFTANYKGRSVNHSALNPVRSEMHTRNMTQMLFINCTLNADFGNRFKNNSRRLNNTDTDNGVIQGTK